MFFTSQSGEMAINDYTDFLAEREEEFKQDWAEAIENKLWLNDPKQFIKMFGIEYYVNMHKEQGVKQLAKIFANQIMFKIIREDSLDYNQLDNFDESIVVPF